MNTDSNIAPEEWEQIEDYLQNNMSDAEQQAFEEKLAAGSEWKDKLKQVQLLMLGVQEAALSARLNHFHQGMPASQKPETERIALFSTKRWLAAAAVLCIIALGSWFFLFRKTENERYYAAYFRPDPGLMTTMGITDNYSFDRAMVDYKTGNYAAALTAWKGMLQNAPQNDTLNYFIGVAWLAGGEAKQAIPYLQKVSGLQKSYFQSDAHWYMGLALLKEGKKEEAVTAIRQSNHPQKEALLQQLQ